MSGTAFKSSPRHDNIATVKMWVHEDALKRAKMAMHPSGASSTPPSPRVRSPQPHRAVGSPQHQRGNVPQPAFEPSSPSKKPAWIEGRSPRGKRTMTWDSRRGYGVEESVFQKANSIDDVKAKQGEMYFGFGGKPSLAEHARQMSKSSPRASSASVEPRAGVTSPELERMASPRTLLTSPCIGLSSPGIARCFQLPEPADDGWNARLDKLRQHYVGLCTVDSDQRARGKAHLPELCNGGASHSEFLDRAGHSMHRHLGNVDAIEQRAKFHVPSASVSHANFAAVSRFGSWPDHFAERAGLGSWEPATPSHVRKHAKALDAYVKSQAKKQPPVVRTGLSMGSRGSVGRRAKAMTGHAGVHNGHRAPVSKYQASLATRCKTTSLGPGCNVRRGETSGERRRGAKSAGRSWVEDAHYVATQSQKTQLVGSNRGTPKRGQSLWQPRRVRPGTLA